MKVLRGFAFLTLFLPAVAQAQVPAGDAAAGYMFAREACAQCHVVTDNQPQPYALAVPSFFDIANDSAATVSSLNAFLRTPHDRMPDFILKQGDVDNVIAYILSLRGRTRTLPPAPPTPPSQPKTPQATKTLY